MRHIYTFTTKKYLRAADKCLTSPKAHYLKHAGKFPWVIISGYVSLLFILFLIGDMSLLIAELIPAVSLIGLVHVSVYLVKSWRYSQIIHRLRRPVIRLEKKLKPYFKIKLISQKEELKVLLFRENMTYHTWHFLNKDFVQINLVENTYLYFKNTEQELIIPRSLFVIREFEHLIAPYRELIQNRQPHRQVNDVKKVELTQKEQIAMIPELQG